MAHGHSPRSPAWSTEMKMKRCWRLVVLVTVLVWTSACAVAPRQAVADTPEACTAAAAQTASAALWPLYTRIAQTRDDLTTTEAALDPALFAAALATLSQERAAAMTLRVPTCGQRTARWLAVWAQQLQGYFTGLTLDDGERFRSAILADVARLRQRAPVW
jgi:hypothetical protein